MDIIKNISSYFQRLKCHAAIIFEHTISKASVRSVKGPPDMVIKYPERGYINNQHK